MIRQTLSYIASIEVIAPKSLDNFDMFEIMEAVFYRKAVVKENFHWSWGTLGEDDRGLVCQVDCAPCEYEDEAEKWQEYLTWFAMENLPAGWTIQE